MFLEEDHYVAEDFLPVLAMMQAEAARLPGNKVASLSLVIRSFSKLDIW